jgi:hypothetical protein
MIAALIPMLAYALGFVAVRVLIALGLSFVTFVGFSALMGHAVDFINTQLAGVSSSIAQFLVTVNVPQAITIITSAITTRVAMTGLRRVVWKGLIG